MSPNGEQGKYIIILIKNELEHERVLMKSQAKSANKEDY